MITPELIARVKTRLGDRASYEHFFNTIEDPAWIKPLLGAGFFKNPDSPMEQDGYISFPFWPESRYLLRMAEKAPDDVFLAVQTIPNTTNQRVLEDIVQVLLKLDSAKSVKLTQRVVASLDIPYSLRLHAFAAELAAKLATDRHLKAALSIAKTLLDVGPDPKLAQMSKQERKYALLQPHIKYRDYDYEEILKKTGQAIAEADPIVSIEFFSELLDKAIRYKLHRYEDEGSDIEDEDALEDYSAIWRPNIGGTGRSHDSQPRNGLVSAVRDSVTALMSSELDNSARLIVLKDLCTNKRFTVYKRIVEYVLRDYKELQDFQPLYNALFEELKPITETIELERMSGEFTPNAGITIDELAALNDDELIEKLTTYEPVDPIFGRDAMGDVVTALTKNDLPRFIGLGERLIQTKNQYVNALFFAAESNIDNLNEVNIADLLLIARKFLDTGTPEGATEERYYDWTVMSIARLLDKLAGQRENKSEYLTAITANLALQITLKLCRDPDPTPADEERYGGDNMDPTTLSVNTVRGEAMHALCRLILWATRNQTQEEMHTQIYDELSWHLDEKNDPSLAVRAVYGQWLPWIWHANKDWLQANLEKIFSSPEYAAAAWDAYITLNQVYNDLLPVVEPIMRKQIGDLAEYQEEGKGRGDARSQFAHHIMVYYWRGRIDLSEGSVADEFLKTADPHYRANAIRYIGFELRKESPPDKEIVERLATLWENRLKAASTDPDAGVMELEQFGGWFASGVFEDAWALQKLRESLAIAHTADPDFMVLEKLEEFASTSPLSTMECLKEMIAGARERWELDSWSSNAMSILKTAYNSKDEDAKKLAEEQANLLVAQGYHNFREAIK